MIRRRRALPAIDGGHPTSSHTGATGSYQIRRLALICGLIGVGIHGRYAARERQATFPRALFAADHRRSIS
jgi:hypothetical protein